MTVRWLSFWMYFLLCLGTVSAQTNAVSTSRPTLAILDFEGSKGIEKEQLEAITDRFQSEVIRRGQFTVLDRSQMDVILREQGFQQSGLCNENECHAKVGQLLGVGKLVTGKVVAIESIWAISIRYIDVESGKVETVISYEVAGGLTEVLRSGCADGAERLSRFVASGGVHDTTTAAAVRQVPSDAVPKLKQSKGLSTKRKMALALLGVSLAGAGTGVYFNSAAESAADDYDAADANHKETDLRDAYDQLDNAKTGRTVSYGVSIGTGVLAVVLWLIPEGGD